MEIGKATTLASSGNFASGNVYSPNTFQWPSSYPVYVQSNEYANEVDVKPDRYDAEVTFYLRTGNTRHEVTKVRIPLGLLDQVLPKKGAKR